MWDKLKELWAGILLLVSLLWIEAHLILIKIYGVVEITEGNSWILHIEIIVVSLLLILAIERFIGDIRK